MISSETRVRQSTEDLLQKQSSDRFEDLSTAGDVDHFDAEVPRTSWILVRSSLLAKLDVVE